MKNVEIFAKYFEIFKEIKNMRSQIPKVLVQLQDNEYQYICVQIVRHSCF